MTAIPWVRVVIVNYNGGALLAAVLDALAQQTMTDFQVVIVDNGSTDGALDRLTLPDPRFSILAAGKNLGFAAGSNLGARNAATPWLAMLNPDAVPAPDWLEQLRHALIRYPHTALFGSTQLRLDDPTRLDGAGDTYSIFGIAWRGGYGAAASVVTGDHPTFSPCAAAALYRRDVFEAAGGFAESFFCYLEDVDLGFRLRLAGHSVLQIAQARVRHAGSAISGRHSSFTLYHSTRNGIWLMVRCLPLPLLLLSLPLYGLAQLWLMTRTPGWRARVQGLRDGLAALPQAWRQRRIIQETCRRGMLAVALWLTWNPRRVSAREIVKLTEDRPDLVAPTGMRKP